MSGHTTVFLLGATGYIGGATLQLLLKDPSLSIIALVRNKVKAAKLEQLGVKTVIGTFDDAALLEAEAAKADAVIQSAVLDNADGVNALLKGAKTRFEKTGKQPVYIQTSGLGTFAKLDAMGEYTTDRVLSDMDPNLLDFKSSHKASTVNDIIIAADGEGYVRTYIVYCSVIFGTLKGPLVDAGISHAYSMLISWSAKFSLQRGQGAVVGKGLNRWPVAHIDDTANFYKILLEKALANDAPHGAQGNYAVANGEISLIDAAKRYTAVLHAHGKSTTAEPESFTAPEFDKIPLLYFLGTDVRVTADRARTLGWKPVYGTEEFFESVQEDTEAVLAGKD